MHLWPFGLRLVVADHLEMSIVIGILDQDQEVAQKTYRRAAPSKQQHSKK